jgi:hypothetical protein
LILCAKWSGFFFNFITKQAEPKEEVNCTGPPFPFTEGSLEEMILQLLTWKSCMARIWLDLEVEREEKGFSL